MSVSWTRSYLYADMQSIVLVTAHNTKINCILFNGFFLTVLFFPWAVTHYHTMHSEFVRFLLFSNNLTIFLFIIIQLSTLVKSVYSFLMYNTNLLKKHDAVTPNLIAIFMQVTLLVLSADDATTQVIPQMRTLMGLVANRHRLMEAIRMGREGYSPFPGKLIKYAQTRWSTKYFHICHWVLLSWVSRRRNNR